MKQLILVLLCSFCLSETLPIDNVTTLTGWFFEIRDGVQHCALDISSNQYTPIRAVNAGKVIYVDFDYGSSKREGYGNYVMIKDNDGYTWLYAHCQRLLVIPGQEINEGQIIAEVGSTGLKTRRSHVHLEKRDRFNKKMFFTKDFGINWEIK
jgi:murein DD-endopeptidase MepM/ murein hydrolase activator NlpD